MTDLSAPMAKKLHVLLMPVGSAGDVYPFLGLGRALRERGHHVTMLTSGYFQGVAEREGMDFAELISTDDFLRLIGNPFLWHPIKGTKAVLECFDKPSLLDSCHKVTERYKPGETVALTSCIGFGARLAHDVIGIPLVTLDLQPMVLWSGYDSPRLPGIPRGRFVPRWLKNMVYACGERLVLERLICPQLNAARKELGLPPIRRLTSWWHSPQAILGLWPEWYGPRQPDWPAHLHLIGFPIWTEQANQALSADLESYLCAGEPPIVFTPGTANMFGHDFFRAAVKACQILGKRGLLLSKFDEHIPGELPESVRHVRYAAFPKLLPRVSAIVHHGGIGTTSNALLAGIPQLVMPLSHDQPDNAHRLNRLGVGDWLLPRNFHGPAVAKKLRFLLSDSNVAAAVERWSQQMKMDGSRPATPFAEACHVVESVATIGHDNTGRMAR